MEDLDILERIQKLIDLGEGDTGRLYYIRESLKKQKSLYNSDEKYLEALLDYTKVEENLNPNDSSNLITSIEFLIQSGIGDYGRLHHIRDTLTSGKKLYNSDKKYLDHKLEIHPIKKPDQTVKKKGILNEPAITKLQSKLVEANEKFSQLEKIKEKAMITKSDIKEKISTKNIESILKDIKPSKFIQENSKIEKLKEGMNAKGEKIEKQKKLISHIDLQEEKLAQLAKNRDEFDQNVSLEKQRIKGKIENIQKNIVDNSNLTKDSSLKSRKFSKFPKAKNTKKTNLVNKNSSKQVKKKEKKFSKRRKN